MDPRCPDEGHVGFLGQSTALAALRNRVRVIAGTPVPVLISGESGTGKGLIARCLHAWSSLSELGFHSVDCMHDRACKGNIASDIIASIEDNDIEGVVHFRDVDRLSLDQQIRLLQIVQELGQRPSFRSMQVRIVASTTADLRAMSDRGAFSSDLLFALSAAQIRSLPLRCMPEDVPVLVSRFIAVEAARYERPIPTIDPHLPHLLTYQWPGNIPELRSYAVRLVLDLDEAEASAKQPQSLADHVAWFERQIIIQHLQSCGGNIQSSCRNLMVSRTTLYEKINRHGINIEDYKVCPNPSSD